MEGSISMFLRSEDLFMSCGSHIASHNSSICPYDYFNAPPSIQESQKININYKM